MYVGRIVAVGRSNEKSWVGYRVSSRSFPNRTAEVLGSSIMVSPKNLQDLAKNPYIAYNCIRTNGNAAIVANGTQADTIIEKMEDGFPPLDAIAFTLLAYSYERDELDTPRLAGAIRGSKAWLGIAMKGEFRVKEFTLKDGDAFMVATYEKTGFERLSMSGHDALEVSKAALALPFEKPVCSASAMQADKGSGFELAVFNPA
jgi:IMP cyclohydrolase